MSQALAAAAARNARGAAAPAPAVPTQPGRTPGQARPGARPSARRPPLRVVAAPATSGSRLGFAVLCAGLLGAGLIVLLLMNTALSQNTFAVQKLQAQTQALTDQRQALAQSVALASSPQQLSAKAWSLGLVPSAESAFVDLPSGKILGVASPAPRATPPTVLGTNTTGTTSTTATTGGPSSGTAPGASPAIRVDPTAPTGLTPAIAPVVQKATTGTTGTTSKTGTTSTTTKKKSSPHTTTTGTTGQTTR